MNIFYSCENLADYVGAAPAAMCLPLLPACLEFTKIILQNNTTIILQLPGIMGEDDKFCPEGLDLVS
jgi:hypothetical protein